MFCLAGNASRSLVRSRTLSKRFSSGVSAKITDSEDLPVVRLIDFYKGGAAKDTFVETVGNALKDVGVFVIQDHGFDTPFRNLAYQHAQDLFELDDSVKNR